MPVSTKPTGTYWASLTHRNQLSGGVRLTPAEDYRQIYAKFPILGRIYTNGVYTLVDPPLSDAKTNWDPHADTWAILNSDGNELGYFGKDLWIDPMYVGIQFNDILGRELVPTGARVSIQFRPDESWNKFGIFTPAQSTIYFDWPEIWNPP